MNFDSFSGLRSRFEAIKLPFGKFIRFSISTAPR
jgi:hypothetical protein